MKTYFKLGLFLAVFAGASAGLVATVMLNTSLDNYAASLFSGRQPAGPAAARVAATSDDNARAAVKTVADNSLVIITKASLDTHTPASLIGENAALGYGVVVSTDGWVLLRHEVIADQKAALPAIDLWINGVRYTPKQIINDTLSDAVLLKVEATNLTPVAFANSSDVSVGSTVWAALNVDAVAAVSVTNIRHLTNLIVKAEAFANDWQLSTQSPVSIPLFDGHGSLVALTSTANALPMDNVVSFIKNVIRNGAPGHAGFGVYVLDLESALNLDPGFRQKQTHGALIMAPSSAVAAVAKSSPAALAGLAAGDIITQIDGSQVDHSHTLAELLQLYAPGETISLTYVHNGEVITTTLALVDASNLLY